MKILWLSHFVPYPPKAGVLIRGHYMVRELAKYHQVDVLAFNQRALIEPYFPSYDEGTRLARENLRQFCDEVAFVDCPVDGSPYARHLCALRSLVSRHPYNINWLKSRQFAKLLRQQLQQKQYDHIHCDTISLAPYVNLDTDATTSLDHHNVESHMLLRRAELENNALKKFYFWQEGKRLQRVEQYYCPRFDLNITCSELDTKRFQGFIDDANFLCVPNGVDIERFQPGTREPDRARLIFIGTLDWYPNLRAVNFLATEIWPRLKQKLPDAQVDIIGANPPAPLLELSRREPDFRVHGFVDDLNEYLESATAYVCPIDDGGGTKLKILDALAAGKAIIANPIACEGIQCSDGDNVLFATNADTYVEHMLRLIANPSLRKSIESKARRLAVEKYAYINIGKMLSDELTFLQTAPATETVSC